MKIVYRAGLATALTMSLIIFVASMHTGRVNAQADSCNFANAAWINTSGFGLSCVDDTGWHSYTSENGFSSSEGLAVCPDSIYFGSSLKIKKFDGQNTQDLPSGKWIGVQNISCGDKGTLWVSYIQGVSYFDGSKWTNYEKQFGTGPFTTILKKVVAGPNGTAWVITNGSVSQFDGKNWTAYENGKGFTKDYNFSDLVIDAQGQAWAVTSDGLLNFKDGKWLTVQNKAINGALSLAIAADGKLWVGTNNGLASYDGKAWTTYNHKNSKLSANTVNSVVLDAQGRVWAGTDYGLNVFDGKNWSLYLMSNSDILDNHIGAIQITANGPNLPATKDKKPGSITGLITSGKSPVVGATFQLCTEFVGGMFQGATPCGDNPYSSSVKTDATGIYTLNNVPVGRYGFVIQRGDGKWIQFIGIDSRIEVTEDQSTELPTIDVSKVG
jgi:ligand-binding sensor domain-containing protein